MMGQAICFTASEGLAYKCPLEAKSLASPQFIRNGMTTMAGAELARWRVAPHTGSSPPKTGNLPTAQKKRSVTLTLLSGLLNSIRTLGFSPQRGDAFFYVISQIYLTFMAIRGHLRAFAFKKTISGLFLANFW